MNINNGVILQDRNILDSPIMTFANAFTVYMYLKLKANWKEGSFYFGYQKVTLQEGQILFKQSEVARELKISRGSFGKILMVLQDEGLICINKTTNKYTVVTIENYHVDFTEYKQTNNKRTTNEQQHNSVSKNSNKLKSTPNNSNKILDKSNGDKSPQGDKKEFGSAEVNAVEKSIRKRLGYLPIAYKGKERFVIHNMIKLCTPMGTSGVKKGRGWMQDSWRSNWANFWKEEMDKYEHGNLRIEKMETLYDKLKLWIDKETTKFIKQNNEYSKERKGRVGCNW